MTEPKSDRPGGLGAVHRRVTLRDPRLRATVLSILGVAILALLVLGPVAQVVDDLAGVAVGVATAVFLLVILLDYGAKAEDELGSLNRRVRGANNRLAAQEKQLEAIDERLADVTRQQRLEVFGNEEHATPRQLEFIRTNPLRFVRLCEYSTLSIEPLLNCLVGCESLRSIQILVASPALASPFQSESRLIHGLHRLEHKFPLEAARRRGLRIRCYSEPASLRGRNFSDELIVVGWYTYHVKKESLGPNQIWGDENALVSTPCTRPEGKDMRDMFEEVFQAHWRTAETLQAAWDPRLPDVRKRHPEFPPPEWLEVVSA